MDIFLGKISQDIKQKIYECIFQGLTIINEYRRHFKENGYFPRSKRYLSNVNKFILPDRIKTLYKPAIKCESVQLILEVK